MLVERSLSGAVDIRKNQRFERRGSHQHGRRHSDLRRGGDDLRTGRHASPLRGARHGPAVVVRERPAISSRSARAPRWPRRPSGAACATSCACAPRTAPSSPAPRSSPTSTPSSPGSRLDLFNRDRDSLRLTWRSVVARAAIWCASNSPFGAFLLYTDSTHITLKGDLRNYFASSLERVLIPGFRQRVSVAAVDSNFFDYYRSRNDPFTGSGIINNLDGGHRAVRLGGEHQHAHARRRAGPARARV